MSKRENIMLCYPFEEKRLRKWNMPRVLVQPKLDGIRCRAIITKDSVELISSEGNQINSVPHIKQELEIMSREWLMTYHSLELDGELYTHGKSFQEIESISTRTVNIHNSFHTLQYHIFDIINNERQIDRTLRLDNLCVDIEGMDSLRKVESVSVSNTEEVFNQLEDYYKDGYEGIIVRNPLSFYERKRSTNIMKFKPKQNDFYRIVDVEEEVSIHGSPKGTLGALICESDGKRFGVGTGFTREQRIDMWKYRFSLIGKFAKVEYQHTTQGRKVPRFPVFVSILDINEEVV